ncbi:MAG TPA: hypothetical protein VGC79_16520, partial [Polyangiaceae bacterium]
MDDAQEIWSTDAPGEVLDRIDVLAERFPFDWRGVAQQRDDANAIACEMGKLDPEDSPSRFIPHVLRVALLSSQPSATGNDELEKLGAYSAALLA